MITGQIRSRKVYKRQGTERPAEITVFLSLLLSVLLSFIYILIQSARIEASRYIIEAAMDASLYSCLSEYSKELFERFDLLYIDTAYRSGEGGVDRLSEHLAAYMEENLKDSSGGLLRIALLDTGIGEVRLASDNEGGNIMRQAVYYMENYGETEHDRRYKELKSMEIEFQLNIGSLTGAYGPEVKSKAEHLLDAGMYEYSGTDPAAAEKQ